MNRRSFLLGLLSTTAAPAVSKALPTQLPPGNYAVDIESVSIRTGLPTIVWRELNSGVRGEIPLIFKPDDKYYNGVPIRSVVEMLSQRNKFFMEGSAFHVEQISDEEYYEDDDDE